MRGSGASTSTSRTREAFESRTWAGRTRSLRRRRSRGPRKAPGAGNGPPYNQANALNIPPYNGLADWESRTASDRGRNLRDMVERYPPAVETARAGPPRRKDDPSTISVIVLENGHNYQVGINPRPQECHSNLEAFDSMIPACAALPDGPTSLPQNQPPDPLTAVL